jgi:uncharacterized protein
MVNAINWFEIPATDYKRATAFYGNIFQVTLAHVQMDGFDMGMFPVDPDAGVGGAIVVGEGYVPTTHGSVVYLNGGDDLNGVLTRVEGAGGKVLAEKFSIGENNGYTAYFLDTEGNKVGLHSMN